MYMVKKKFGNFRNFSYLSVLNDRVIGLDDLKTCTHFNLQFSFVSLYTHFSKIYIFMGQVVHGASCPWLY